MNPFKSLAGIAFSALLLASCQKEESFTKQNLALDLEAAANNPQIGGQPEFVANELLVKFKAGTSVASRGKALGLLGASVQEHILTGAMKRANDNEGIFLLKVNANALDAITKAKGLAEVEYAEPNWLYTHDAISNDPSLGSLWGMQTTWGSQAVSAWGNNHTGSDQVYIGIIDEGYMYTHADLKDNAGVNPKEIAGNKRDDDGNGYVDDVYGWDFAGNNSSVFDGTADDHGTHVAGTIGAKGGNGIGVVGVCWTVKMLGAKFLGTRGGTTSNAIKAVDYFTDLKTRAGINIVATNNSWGGGGFSQGLKDAIDRAGAKNILFIAAAGNSGTNNDASASYPSGYSSSNIIAVASITSSGTMSSFSQYGLTTVDLGAPGSSIYSTLPGSGGTSSYGTYSGTSMATPHVTGAAALYAASNSSATASQIKSAIMNAVTQTSSLTGKCVSGGRLNVAGF
jgi:subtilisin family serine protease